MPNATELVRPGLRGWMIADKYDFSERGAVALNDGVLSLGRGNPATGISYHGSQPNEHYELSWEARRIEGSDFFCGLTFPIRGSHATLIIGGWGGGVVGISNINGLSAVENETTTYLEFEKNRWYRFSLKVTETALLFDIDDDRTIDLDHENHKYAVWWEQEQMTPLGFATWHTASEIRHFKLS